MVKICTQCKEEKSLDEFRFLNKAKGIRQSSCAVCARQSSRKSYTANKETVVSKMLTRRRSLRIRMTEYKEERGCSKCPEHYSGCLEFHHPQDDKEFWIGDAIKNGKGWNTIMREVQKCILLCSNCHRKVHGGVLEL